jgi:membrane associated rhomboid family serine protease
MQSMEPDGGEDFVRKYGMIPIRVVKNEAGPMVASLPAAQQLPNGEIQVVRREETLPALTISPWMTVLTCMFLHGSLMHIVGNMWFLVIFGDNIEDRFRHVPFLVMYLVSGIAASLVQIASGPSSAIPTVGASGAIAGVMGAYLVLYPHARVVTLIPLGIIWQTMLLPGPVFLGIWFVFQFVSAAFSPADVGGVAFWAHVGGFVAGVVLAWFGKRSGWLSVPRRRRLEEL